MDLPAFFPYFKSDFFILFCCLIVLLSVTFIGDYVEMNVFFNLTFVRKFIHEIVMFLTLLYSMYLYHVKVFRMRIALRLYYVDIWFSDTIMIYVVIYYYSII